MQLKNGFVCTTEEIYMRHVDKKEDVAKVCGYCLRKLKKHLLEAPRKLISKNHPCDKCPAYYAKVTVRFKPTET